MATEVFVYDPVALVDVLEQLHRSASAAAPASTDNEPEDGSTLGDFGQHLLPAMIDRGRTYGYPMPGYWRDLGRPESYLAAHRELLAGEVSLFAPDWPITTTVEKRAPARLHRGCSVADSMIADGCEIYGSVRNSVLGPGVVVEAGGQVRDSVIFADVTVRSAATVDWSIVDTRHRDRHRRRGRQRQPSGDPGARAAGPDRGRLPDRSRCPGATGLSAGTGHDRRLRVGAQLHRPRCPRMPP